MSPHGQTHKEYDIIIAGGGTAACIVASRLAEADPNLSILIIEQGPNNLDDPAITTPAMFWTHLRPESKYTTFYQGDEEESIDGRRALVPMGRVLGGGSSINFMMYTRAQACDFDSWNTEGWDSETLMSLSRKLETFHPDGPEYDRSVHGYQGPIGVSLGTYGSADSRRDIIAGAVAVGEKELVDLQDFKTASGIAPWFGYISPEGKRQDVAHRYLHPLMASGKYPNLHLLVETTVCRVLFDGTRATGVECRPTPAPAAASPGQNVASGKEPTVVTARKLVVVSAGAFGTPQLLERSGVGSERILSRLGIPLVVDLAGVGEDYQDHNLVECTYKVDLSPSETLDALISGRLDLAGLHAEKHPILRWNGVDVAAKLRPSEAEVAELGPDFQRLWDRDFKDRPERPLMLLAALSMSLGGPEEMAEAMGGTHQYLTMGPYTAYPYSRGSVHILSRDPFSPPAFRSGYLSHPADLKKLVWAYKKQREMMRRTNMFRAEVPIRHPCFPPGSKAALLDRHPLGAAAAGYASPADRSALPPVEYDAADDAAIEDYIRRNVHTSWHSMGTCKMAPRHRAGVVDKDLNVYGVTNLKIADLSICPENVAANTNNTALIVGEKAAVIIGRELGLHIPG
ncbi:hypothetical protein E4U21_003341 [Claviceps maximensis]|nr:hypothetical protein E4U21_003341 [Claviceps maximensis]